MCCAKQQVIGKPVFYEIMDSSTPTPDRSINGLIFFLTLSLFLTVLTSGLLVCLSKIWCGHRKSSSQTAQSEQRQSVAGCSVQDSDSDEDAQPPNRPPMVRRFSQRIINFVQRPFQEESRRSTIVESPELELPVPSAHTIHGAIENVTVVPTGSTTNELPVNDPTCVVYL